MTNEPELKGTFRNTLNENIKDGLVSREEPETLNDLVKERKNLTKTECVSHQSTLKTSDIKIKPVVLPPQTKPTQLGQTKLSPDEMSRRPSSGGCLYCGEMRHFRKQCLVQAEDSACQ
ncbi:hypothetical protein ILYODFUR_037103 [Ilyodon furcidens]|uniref:CCHC-type domain-containing protein n=1 Tax=Ilyodon furcidens TaxID=33524 RepID=A0ABV0U0X1_9TELE